MFAYLIGYRIEADMDIINVMRYFLVHILRTWFQAAVTQPFDAEVQIGAAVMATVNTIIVVINHSMICKNRAKSDCC